MDRIPSGRHGLAWLVLLATPVAVGATHATYAAHAASAKTKARTLNASGELKRTARPAPLTSVQSGRLVGTPFGSGTMVLRSKLERAIVTSTFTLKTSAGTVRGRARARLTLDGDTAHYKGTATITGGTGRYRRVQGSGITFTGVGPVSAKRTTIRLRGTVRY